ncbi:hypothetical protein C8A05DRAFT_15335 [Staphylotrichum tortipilum]|uniref:DUF3752 domain-containing protein n=1 Tax=Staphylotrichum tortipilum TaxID=2831512 RepID=A0AAN6ML52_9PEZI|nr:hypothetical protein C8A05DRAFT_15335 [Staphylotrichum longicolle]
MASIGPQLPPHLQKRKRTPEDDADLGSPPPKASRRANDDEIPLDDDSDDGYGPRAPASAVSTAKGPSRLAPSIGPSIDPSIGRSLPPTGTASNNDEIPLDDDSDSDAAGPAPPPTRRVLGPAPPPAPLSERPPTGPDSDDDSDDDWGPALPGSAAASRAGAAAAAARPAQSSSAEPAVPKRDDWMLAPPPAGGGRTAPDPTKLKARKFASGPRAATDGKPAGVSSIWTETPEEKARRLANAVLGREDPNNPSPQPGGGSRPDASSGSDGKNKVDQARVRSYVEQTRGKSLVEEHQAARAAGKRTAGAGSSGAPGRGDGDKWGAKNGGAAEDDDEEDDPSKRAFNWEKDMKVGGRINNSQRKELLNRAANFSGRFSSGKYL